MNNQLGDSHFPFSLSVSKKGDVISAFIYFQSVSSLCDFIEKHSLENLVVFDVGQVYVIDNLTNKAISLVSLATDAKIPFSEIDSETIVLRKDNLLNLLSTFEYYNLCLFDIGIDWTEIQVISQILAYRKHNWKSQDAILAILPASCIFLESHDNCFLTIEAYSQNISKNVFSRMLQIYCGTILAEVKKTTTEVSEISQELLDKFWKDEFGLTVLRKATELKNDYLKIGVANQAYNLREKIEYVPEFWLVYEIQSKRWHVQI